MPTIKLACNLVYKGESHEAGETVEVDAETLEQFPYLADESSGEKDERGVPPEDEASPEEESPSDAEEPLPARVAKKKVTKKKPSK